MYRWFAPIGGDLTGPHGEERASARERVPLDATWRHVLRLSHLFLLAWLYKYVRPPFAHADHCPFEYLQLAASVDRTAEASHQVTSRALMYRYWSCALGGSRSSDWWCWRRSSSSSAGRGKRFARNSVHSHRTISLAFNLVLSLDIVIGSRDNARIL